MPEDHRTVHLAKPIANPRETIRAKNTALQSSPACHPPSQLIAAAHLRDSKKTHADLERIVSLAPFFPVIISG